MISADKFDTWVQAQKEIRSVQAHVRIFLAENRLALTVHEVRSMKSGIYNRLRKCAGRNYPTIDYSPQSNRARPDAKPIEFAAGRELTAISDAIQHNGFALPETIVSLNATHLTHRTANVGQQKAVGGLVKSYTAELCLKDVKLSNAEQLSRRDRETAADLRASLEEARKDKAFLQAMIAPKGGHGNDVI